MDAQEHTDLLAPLEPLLSDPDVVEVLVDGYNKVYVEKHGQFIDMPTLFRDDEHLMEVINFILEWRVVSMPTVTQYNEANRSLIICH